MERRTIIYVAAAVLLLVLLVVGAYYGYVWYKRHSITQDDTTEVPADNETTDAAMSYQEKDYRGTNTVWGIRNNNPGNLRPGDKWQGIDPAQPSDGGFIRYISIKWGIRAALINLSNEIKTYGTIRAYMYHYAPAADHNDPDAYANFVGQQTGLDPDKVPALNADNLIALAWAHFSEENGGLAKMQEYISDADMEAAVALTPYKRTLLG